MMGISESIKSFVGLFAIQSSEVDWCEANWEITNSIAEFYNTISNALFFIIPPLLIHLSRQYSRQVCWDINLVWAGLVIIGIGSVYFHATLSLVGQLMDEIAILWVLMVAIALWTPKRYLPVMYQDRSRFKKHMLIGSVIFTGLACVMPAVNCMVLLLFGVPATVFIVEELRACKDNRVFNLGIRCCVIWILAIASWLSDRLYCKFFESIHFPYLHCLWHIFILLSSYQACVLMAYFDALIEVPEQMPVMQYWPKDTWEFFGIPYVALKCAGTKPDDKQS